MKIIESNEIVPEESWIKEIEKIKSETKHSNKEVLKEVLIDAINKRISKEKFGVFLSGGIDSSFISMICSRKTKDFICYSVGLESSEDLVFAKKLVEHFNLKNSWKVLSLEDVEQLFLRLVKILPVVDVVSLGVGAVELACIDLAKEDNVSVLFGGLGSEEIFAGYERHGKAEDKHGECWRGLKGMWKRDLLRDSSIALNSNISFAAPFLDRNVIRVAMGIDINEKISSDEKKIVLREIAEEEGLPFEFAWRKKKAAQYGSKFDKALEKLAKRRGLSSKKEYVEWLIKQ